MTVIQPVRTSEELSQAVAAACQQLAAGEVVALPTETVYGLAADARRPDAVLKIFEAKERPFFDPLIVHIPDYRWLEEFTAIPAADADLVQRLTARFWPGPLTLVLPRRESVPDLVASGLPTVAVRMSAHPVFSAIVGACGFPLAAPSANRFGRISPTAAAHVESELAGRIPLIIDGGETTHGVESTIVAVADGKLEILRSGPVTREDLAAFAPVVTAGALAKPVAPGQLKSHYAPRTPLEIVESGFAVAPTGQRTGLLAWHRREGNEVAELQKFGKIEWLSESCDLREAATRLFAAMRRLDEAGLDGTLDGILVEAMPETGLGVAIMDRLRKAAYRD